MMKKLPPRAYLVMRSFCGALGVSCHTGGPSHWLGIGSSFPCFASVPYRSSLLKEKFVSIFHKPHVTNGIYFFTLASRELRAKLSLTEVGLNHGLWAYFSSLSLGS